MADSTISTELSDRIFTITREGDRLFFTSIGGSVARRELSAESATTFFLKIRPYVFVFSTAEGQPAQLKIVEGSETYVSKRIR